MLTIIRLILVATLSRASFPASLLFKFFSLMSAKYQNGEIFGAVLLTICFFLLPHCLAGITYVMCRFGVLAAGKLLYIQQYCTHVVGTNPFDFDLMKHICLPLLTEVNATSRMIESRHWYNWNWCDGALHGWNTYQNSLQRLSIQNSVTDMLLQEDSPLQAISPSAVRNRIFGLNLNECYDNSLLRSIPPSWLIVFRVCAEGLENISVLIALVVVSTMASIFAAQKLAIFALLSRVITNVFHQIFAVSGKLNHTPTSVRNDTSLPTGSINIGAHMWSCVIWIASNMRFRGSHLLSVIARTPIKYLCASTLMLITLLASYPVLKTNYELLKIIVWPVVLGLVYYGAPIGFDLKDRANEIFLYCLQIAVDKLCKATLFVFPLVAWGTAILFFIGPLSFPKELPQTTDPTSPVKLFLLSFLLVVSFLITCVKIRDIRLRDLEYHVLKFFIQRRNSGCFHLGMCTCLKNSSLLIKYNCRLQELDDLKDQIAEQNAILNKEKSLTHGYIFAIDKLKIESKNQRDELKEYRVLQDRRLARESQFDNLQRELAESLQARTVLEQKLERIQDLEKQSFEGKTQLDQLEISLQRMKSQLEEQAKQFAEEKSQIESAKEIEMAKRIEADKQIELAKQIQTIKEIQTSKQQLESDLCKANIQRDLEINEITKKALLMEEAYDVKVKTLEDQLTKANLHIELAEAMAADPTEGMVEERKRNTEKEEEYKAQIAKLENDLLIARNAIEFSAAEQAMMEGIDLTETPGVVQEQSDVTPWANAIKMGVQDALRVLSGPGSPTEMEATEFIRLAVADICRLREFEAMVTAQKQDISDFGLQATNGGENITGGGMSAETVNMET